MARYMASIQADISYRFSNQHFARFSTDYHSYCTTIAYSSNCSHIKDQSGLPTYAGYLYAIALCISAIVQAVVHQHIIISNTHA